MRPRLVVALHEGPQDGVFVIGTQITPQSLLERVIAGLREQRIPLASENNLGAALSTPGLMSEGSFITRAKSWLGIYSVGEYTSPLGIQLVTVEVPWSLPDMRERIAAQTAAVQAVARYDHCAIRQLDRPASGPRLIEDEPVAYDQSVLDAVHRQFIDDFTRG